MRMKGGTVSENVRAFGDFGRVGKAVTILMGLGGGVFVEAAPPAHYLTDNTSGARLMSHGLASAFVFVLYFLISASTIANAAASRGSWFRRAAVVFAVGVVVLVAYGGLRGELVVDAHEGEYLVGLWRDGGWIESNAGKDWLNWSSKRLMEDTPWGYPYEEIWPFWSRMAAYALLQVLYVLGILGLFGAVFTLWAGVFGRAGSDC